MEYELSNKNKERLSDEVKRILSSFPIIEVMLENYMNSIDLFFNNFEKEYKLEVDIVVDDREKKPSTVVRLNVITNYEYEEERTQIFHGLNKVLNASSEMMEEGEINKEVLTMHDQRIFLDINNFNNDKSSNLEEEDND